MAATTVTESGGMRIITEVIPATDPRAAQLASSSTLPASATLSFQVRGFRRAQPKALGTIHIFTGIIHVCFGIILTVSEYRKPSLPVASGVLFWLGLLLLVSGSLLVESEKRDNILLVKTCCVVNMGVILSTLVATLVHTTAITHDSPGCETDMPYQLKAEWCFHADNKILTNGLDSMFVIFSFLEFCVAVAALAFGYNAIRQHNYMPMVRGGRGPVTAQSPGVLAPAFRRSGTALPTPFFPLR
ncbi:membrane-spanning 4-domains subfamily A member 15-like [Accipiter gentilis]|uniref:membrane-spanning 4-domains subfamily A member 15-like n=1 Tax=Astur gentilis TaxID=8957 RepID=UPI00210F5CB7|nr:membrane-spanning 4-domains subfamily A member 15-like [Accipiter gentilis]